MTEDTKNKLQNPPSNNDAALYSMALELCVTSFGLTNTAKFIGDVYGDSAKIEPLISAFNVPKHVANRQNPHKGYAGFLRAMCKKQDLIATLKALSAACYRRAELNEMQSSKSGDIAARGWTSNGKRIFWYACQLEKGTVPVMERFEKREKAEGEKLKSQDAPQSKAA